jgi:Mor family transcriptional regulator
MKYLNANLVLPYYLVSELQKYVQGRYLYIPIKEKCHKNWGEISGYRKEIQSRNMEIIKKYKSGISMENLSNTYYLSIYAIKKIVYKK